MAQGLALDAASGISVRARTQTRSWHHVPAVPSTCLTGLCVAPVLEEQGEEKLLLFLEDPVCSELMSIREMCFGN